MHDIDLILTITAAFAAALLLGLGTQRIGLPPIVGYLLAGVVVGPYTPGYTANKGFADQLAEIGVVLLMFGVGLHFHLKELLAVRRIALPGALVQILVATLLGAFSTRFFGWSFASGLVFGLGISVASTVVLTRVLADHDELHTTTGHIAVGWLVVEDLFTVFALVVLPALYPKQGTADNALALVGVAILKLGALLLFTFTVGDRLIPKLLEIVARTRSRELFTLAVLVVALGIAVGSAKLFGASMALGAFLAGMVVGRSDFAARAASEALPMRDAFAVLFFVSVGMLFDPAFLLQKPGLVAATLAVVMLGKPLAAIALVLALGHPRKIAFSTGVALAQIGEFSFIMAGLGVSLGLLQRDALSTLVAVALVSITLNPILYGLVPRFLARFPERVRAPEALESKPDAIPTRAIVVGYGPVGRTVSRLLKENGIEPTIIELNLDTVRGVRAEGKEAIYGDASRREVLEQAGARRAMSLIFSFPTDERSALAIREARELNPTLVVVARCSYLTEVDALRRAGANQAFSGEGEVALAMTAAILQRLGRSPEQIEGERARVHGELVAPAPLG
jgi:CPA2 family monovalent cation:H+ antiporter-2